MTENVSESVIAEKEEIDAEFFKWNEFPTEIKMECIKKMDFKMRDLFRCASRTERALVDAHNEKDRNMLLSVRLDYKKFKISGHELEFNYRDENDVVNEKMIHFIPHILSTYYIDSFHLAKDASLGKKALSKMELLIPNGSIRSNSVELENQDIQTMAFFLRKFWTSLEDITLYFYYKYIPFKWYQELFKIPSVINAEHLWIEDVHGKAAIKMIRLWRQIDVKVGSTLRANLYDQYDYFELAICDYKSEEIVYRDDEKLRITTNFPGKHLVIMADEEHEHLHCAVIPADADNDDIEKYFDIDESFEIEESDESDNSDESDE